MLASHHTHGSSNQDLPLQLSGINSDDDDGHLWLRVPLLERECAWEWQMIGFKKRWYSEYMERRRIRILSNIFFFLTSYVNKWSPLSSIIIIYLLQLKMKIKENKITDLYYFYEKIKFLWKQNAMEPHPGSGPRGIEISPYALLFAKKKSVQPIIPSSSYGAHKLKGVRSIRIGVQSIVAYSPFRWLQTRWDACK